METLPSVTGIGHYGDCVDSTHCAHVSHHSLDQKTHLTALPFMVADMQHFFYQALCKLNNFSKFKTDFFPNLTFYILAGAKNVRKKIWGGRKDG